jgi:hypothetical protein
MLRSVVTELSRQAAGHRLTLEYGTDRLSRNVGNELPITLRNIPEERNLTDIAAEA